MYFTLVPARGSLWPSDKSSAPTCPQMEHVLNPPEDAEYRNQPHQEPGLGTSTSQHDSGPLSMAGSCQGKAGQQGAAGLGHHRHSLISHRKSCENHLAEAHGAVAALSDGGQRADEAPLVCRAEEGCLICGGPGSICGVETGLLQRVVGAQRGSEGLWGL